MTHPLRCLFFRPVGAGQQQERLFQSRTDHFEIAQLDSMLGESLQDSLRVLGKQFKFSPSKLEGLHSDQGIELLNCRVWGTEAVTYPWLRVGDRKKRRKTQLKAPEVVK
jgi:hypothetical protein